MDFKILLERITPALKAIARRHLLTSFYSEDDLYQEMCLHLWQKYGLGLPIGINESYVIKGCEFHILNFLRKGRPKALFSSFDEVVAGRGLTMGEMLEDKTQEMDSILGSTLTVDEIHSIGLTEKEHQVFSHLLNGNTVRETADKMGISHVMVMKYKKNIVKKFNKWGYQE